MSGSSGSEIFETYEKEYATLHDSISRRIATVIPTATGEQRKLLVNQTKRELEEADEIIGQMEMELLSLPPNIKSKFAPRVKSFKDEVKKAKKDLTKASGQADRDALLGPAASGPSHVVDFEAASMDQRGRLINGTERLQEGTRRLEDAKRLALEAETMGINTLGNLNSQREQILRTRDTLGTADSWITKSQGVLKGMQQQMQQNKLITYGIIAALALMIIVVIWLKWF